MPLNRETSITYLGHAALLLETPGGKRIVIDPWTIHNPACPQEWKQIDRLGKLDIILLTHLHSDHAQDAPEIARANPDAVIVGAYEVCNWMAGKGAANINPMNTGGTISVEGVEITMTPALHSSSYQEEDGTVVYGGEPAGYILKLENGFTLYAAGDTALFGDMALLKELYHPELAFLPIGDRFTMGPREAAYATKLLGVAHVVPIHYATFPLLTGTPEQLRESLGASAVTIHAIKPGETLR